jgi:hypothetical protein
LKGLSENFDVVFPDNLVIPNYMVTEINALDHLSITFSTEWPLSVIFDSKIMDEYNQIFKFLIKIQRVVYILSKKDLWRHSNKDLHPRKINKEDEDEDESDLRDLIDANSRTYNAYQHQFLLFQRELLHFAKNLETFIKTRVLLHCTSEFERNLAKVENMDTLIRFHNGFVGKVLDLCLLQQSSQQLRDTILNVLNNAIQLRECFKQFSKLDLHSERMKIDAHNIMKDYMKLCENHKICMRFITAFMERQKTKSNLLSHLDDAYCRLNFNYFYS